MPDRQVNVDKSSIGSCVPLVEDQQWMDAVAAVVDLAHAENLGGKHRTGFCEACADAYLVAQRAVPRTKAPPDRGDSDEAVERALKTFVVMMQKTGTTREGLRAVLDEIAADPKTRPDG